jgi:lipoprotein-anchoring transpeptidase ErfK/SrfK
MPRWIGLLGSWAIFVLALGFATFALAGEWINVQDQRRLLRMRTVDELFAERHANRINALRRVHSTESARVSQLQARVDTAQKQIEEREDSERKILVSTAENMVYLREGGQTTFQATCSTGKGKTIIDKGRTMAFDTPIGKFRILSKEENPVWVPPDWHFLEEASKRGMRVVQMRYGDTIDARTGIHVSSRAGGGVWSWFGSGDRVLKIANNNVVLIENGVQSPLPAGELITAGDAVVIPPVGVSQRKFERVLGSHRLNLGDGYALHGTQQVAQLGRSVSHGCVRLKNEDIARLYEVTDVGDEVIIY